jgi:hypothetical protein
MASYQVDMSKKLQPSLALAAALRPIVRFCLKHGVRSRELDEFFRKSLVEEARAMIEEAGGEVSVSKISVVTGIHRVEVARLLAGKRRPRGKHDVLNRVIGLWLNGATYRNGTGGPRPLSFQGLTSEFAELVARVSKEVSHYPLLFELERIEAIEYLGDRVRLVASEYTPTGDTEHGLGVMEDDIATLLETVEGNLAERSTRPDLHLRTMYDNIPPEKLEEIRAWVLARGAAFQGEIREYLSKFDRDLNPQIPTGSDKARVSVTVFSSGRVIDKIKQLKPKKRGRKKASPPVCAEGKEED